MKITQLVEILNGLNTPRKFLAYKNLQRALYEVNNPQDSYKIIHIAGTNGKGSTSTLINQGLIASGFKVGKFISPYIKNITESITINNQAINEADLIDLFLKHKCLIQKHQLSSFETLTLLMFIYFKTQAIDYLVLECGIGGLDDATNVVNSNYSLITNISLEHQEYLGGSLASIAKHKAGILKSGYIFIADNTPELLNELKNKPYTNILDIYDYQVQLDYLKHLSILNFKLKTQTNYQQVKLKLFGIHQALNFLLAYSVLSHIGLDYELIRQALSLVSLAGRIEKKALNLRQNLIYDTSHNLAGVSALVNSLNPYYNSNNTIIICSILQDKNILAMLKLYAKLSHKIIFCPISKQSRNLSPFKLAALAKGLFKEIYICYHPQIALKMAKKTKLKNILISGSIYLLKEYF